MRSDFAIRCVSETLSQCNLHPPMHNFYLKRMEKAVMHITPMDDQPHSAGRASLLNFGERLGILSRSAPLNPGQKFRAARSRLPANRYHAARPHSGEFLVSPNIIFWEVDPQADFMLPGGKLYVPGAEKILPNIDRLVEAARRGRVFLLSSADAHNPGDPELRDWPAHCLKGSPGADLVPQACASNRLVIPNQETFSLPADLSPCQQVTLEKNTLDVFDNPNADALLARLTPAGSPAFGPNPEFVIFGVATEYCVRLAADGLLRRGLRVAVVTDAVRALDFEKGRQVLENLQSRGARLITTGDALSLLEVSSSSIA